LAPLKILAIETSCDETAAAVVEDGHRVLSSIVSSQIDLHARFGGVVPEVASRAHVELLTPVVREALAAADVDGRDLGAVAATVGPGLVGSLLVGVSAAKAYSLAWDVPFVGVNHMEAHLHAAFLEQPDLLPPMVVLLASGGHTLLVWMDRSADGGVFPFAYRLLGQTIDDAAGEAFDKVARFLGLGYPGGPAIERAAGGGDPRAIAFPRGMIDEGFDFSFSGLKTSVITYVRKHPEAPVADVAASFQEAVVDVLVTKARRAARDVGARALCLGGGVAANSALRQRVADACRSDGLRAYIPSRDLCTDNAAMIGATAWYRLVADGPTPLDAGARPNLPLPAG
jgi:N6-L-threonylcarbamoyladenine synthase